ncbi:baseplate protein [Citrobacter koseri]|nr:baseplate protein [Citrobacter freundii]HCB1565996.1 baseplate protein [Citrobacter freundii]HEB2429455.1 baseplate protein [Citrobacter freundii]
MTAPINGPQRAKVVTVDDPAGLLRVSVRLVGIWDSIPDGDLPWAERMPPDDGAFIPLLAGDDVWVDFPYSGDSTRPRVVGRATDAPGGVPNTAPEASGQGSPYQPPAVEGAPAAGKTTPGKDYVSDRNGLLEIRNQSGSWSITHKASGSTMGVNDSGQLYISSQLSLFVHSVSDMTIKSDANINMSAAGKISIKGAEVAIDKS